MHEKYDGKNLKVRDHMGAQGGFYNYSYKKWDRRVWTGFIWLRIRSSGKLF
jgi:hypothetical protein